MLSDFRRKLFLFQIPDATTGSITNIKIIIYIIIKVKNAIGFSPNLDFVRMKDI